MPELQSGGIGSLPALQAAWASLPGVRGGQRAVSSPFLVRTLDRAGLGPRAWWGQHQPGLVPESAEKVGRARGRLPRGGLLQAALVQSGAENRAAQHDDAQ